MLETMTCMENGMEMKLEDLRISFVLGSKFPTSRAYGVTTRETLEVLLKHSIKFNVYCLKSSYTDQDFDQIMKNVIYMRVLRISKILRNLSNYGNSKVNYVIWRLALFLDLFINFRAIKNFAPNVIWTRDPFIAYLLLKWCSKVQVILEVHESVGTIFYKKLINLQRVHFFPINKENNSFLCELSGSKKTYEIMPMGVRNYSTPSVKEIDQYVKNLDKSTQSIITIGYVGALEPSGYSKGIEELIRLSTYFQNNSLRYKILLIGASESELKKYTNIKNNLNLSSRYLSILPHVSHSEALLGMKKCDILILPAYKSKLYMGMPIKLLEYLISGRITLIGDCELYRNFLPDYLHPLLYSSGDPEVLTRFIKSAHENRNLYKLLEMSVSFSSSFTWEKRTLRMLDSIRIH